MADYAALSLKFYVDGKFTTIQGEQSHTPAQAQLHHIRRLYQTKAIAEFFAIQLVQHNQPNDSLLKLPPNRYQS